MTDRGFIPGKPEVLGLFGIYDPQGDFGISLRRIEQKPQQTGAEAVRASLKNAGRPGESPQFIWINSTPGYEEDILTGIESVLGPNIPVLGGSAADNNIAGNWSVLANGTNSRQAVVVSSIFSSAETAFSLHSGHSPTSCIGVATKTKGRILQEIDGHPAATVYNEWTDGCIKPILPQGGNVLALTNSYPLARFKQNLGKVPLYVLSHPGKVFSDHSISLFTDMQNNDNIILMSGNRKSLVNRPSQVLESILTNHDYQADQIQGALIVFCAGSMLAIRDSLESVQDKIKSLLGEIPFLTIFTFGEQGCLTPGSNYHGNLMVSAILFTNLESAL